MPTAEYGPIIADDGAAEVVTGSMFSVLETETPQFTLAGLPQRLPMSASRDALMTQNLQLFDLLEQAQHRMQIDYVLKKLMDRENGRLCARLFDKSHKHMKKMTTSHARHMTSDEVLDALEGLLVFLKPGGKNSVCDFVC